MNKLFVSNAAMLITNLVYLAKLPQDHYTSICVISITCMVQSLILGALWRDR